MSEINGKRTDGQRVYRKAPSSQQKSSQRRRVKLADGTYAVYMGETGENGSHPPRRRPSQSNVPHGSREVRPGIAHPEQSPSANRLPSRGTENMTRREGFVKKHSISPEERRIIEERRRMIMERRAAESAAKRGKTPREDVGEIGIFARLKDLFRSWHLGISVSSEGIIKGCVAGALLVVLAMLQVTVFTEFRLFGAVPDLMLPLVIAIAMSEGERWGGVFGLCAAFLIDCLGSTGITLLPLLYVPVGYAVGVLGTYYLRGSFTVRTIYTVCACVLKSIVTVICVVCTYDSPEFGRMMGGIVIPEFFSTLVLSVIPHFAAWLCLKGFHKTRADRVN